MKTIVINQNKLLPIDQLLLDHNNDNDQLTLIVKSAMGTGKSTIFIDYIENVMGQNELLFNNKTLLLANRRSILLNLSGRSGSSIQFYEKKSSEQLRSADKLCITIESLHKLTHNNNNSLPHYSLLIIDELPATLDQLLSSTVKNTRYTFAILRHLVQTTDQVMVFSSDERDVDINFIRELRKDHDHIYHIINEYKEGGQVMKVYPKYENFKRLIMNEVRAAKRIYIGTDSKLFAKKIYSEITEIMMNSLIKVRMYCSENASLKHIKNELLNPNEHWLSFDIIIATPTITHGIDFNVPDHFDCQFYYASGKSIVPRNMIQAMKRVRSFKERMTHLHVVSDIHQHHTNVMNNNNSSQNDHISYVVDQDSGQCVPDLSDSLTSLIIAHHDEVNDKKQLLTTLENIWVNDLGNSWLIIHDEVVNDDKNIISELNDLFGYTSNKFKSPLSKKNLPRTVDKIIDKWLTHFHLLTNDHNHIWVSTEQTCTQYEIRLFLLLISVYSLLNPKFKSGININKDEYKNDNDVVIKVIYAFSMIKKIQMNKGNKQMVLTKGKKRLRNSVYEYEYFLLI